MRVAHAALLGLPSQNVRQVRQRLDLPLRARSHQALQRCRALRRGVRAAEQIVLPPERDPAELLLAQVVIQPEPPVLEEPLERCPVIYELSCRLGERRARWLPSERGDQASMQPVREHRRALLAQRSSQLSGALLHIGQPLDDRTDRTRSPHQPARTPGGRPGRSTAR